MEVEVRGRAKARRAWWLRALIGVCLALLAGVALLYFRQHSMIYHPRPYDASYARSLPPQGIEIEYALPSGKQTAYYLPGRERVPRRLWLAFCGNGSLALDWTTILAGYPNNEDAFLLVDYPGYGKNAGNATIDVTRFSAESAWHALAERLHVNDEQLPICVIGHSLGAAVALDFAAHHRVQRIVAIAPFTTLREEAARVIGRPLSHLLSENYDNRARLRQIAKEDPRVPMAIFHGMDDEIIPVGMGRELAHEFPFVDFFPIEGADHVSVLTLGRDQMISWMNR